MKRLHRIAHRSLLATVVIAALSACGDDGVEPTWPPEVDGTWAWVQSVERTTEEVLTPASEGYSATLLLRVDEDNGTGGQYEYRREGDVVANGRFAIAAEDELGNDFIAWDPPFDDFHQQQGLAAWNDTLWVMDATIGGYEVTWVREP